MFKNRVSYYGKRSQSSPIKLLNHLALCMVIAIPALPAGADVTIVSTVTFSQQTIPAPIGPTSAPNSSSAATGATPRNDTPPTPETVTTYFQGGNARVEVAGGDVILYDGASGKVYTLDPAQNTYYAQDMKTLEDDSSTSSRSPDEHAEPMAVNNGVSVSQSGEQRNFAGLTATAFIVTGTVTVHPQSHGGSNGSHHRFGGLGSAGGVLGGIFGGWGGGGARSDDSSGSAGDYGGYGDASGSVNFPSLNKPAVSRAQTVEVSGEFWLSGAVKLPNDKNASVFPALYWTAERRSFVFEPLADSLSKWKEIPLSSRIAVAHSLPDGSQDASTTTITATSVTQTALSSTLFELPVGYTEIAPPADGPQKDVSAAGP
jgi:hypothetical protein